MPKSILVQAYCQVGVPLDRLPYCEAFARLRVLVQKTSGERIDQRSLWEQLLRLRKNGELPRLMR